MKTETTKPLFTFDINVVKSPEELQLEAAYEKARADLEEATSGKSVHIDDLKRLAQAFDEAASAYGAFLDRLNSKH